MSFKKTVKKVLNTNCSIARFGDGEFAYLLGDNMNFEYSNHDNSLLLKKALQTRNNNILICITGAFKANHFPFTKKARKYYKDYLLAKYEQISRLLDFNYFYGDALITRFYMDYKNKKEKTISKKIELLKKIWEKRNLLIVEGNESKLGVGTDLFDNSKSKKRIECPSTGCMSLISKIINSIRSNYNDNDLVLIALGPTASCIATILPQTDNIQCIDIGHIDVEYIWYKNHLKEKTKIIGKSSAEAKGNNTIKLEYNEFEYKKEIVEKISN